MSTKYRQMLLSYFYYGVYILLMGTGVSVSFLVSIKFLNYFGPIKQLFGSWSIYLYILVIISFILCLSYPILLIVKWKRGNTPKKSLAPFRMFFYLLILGSIIKFIIFPQYHIVLFLITITYCYGLFSLLLILSGARFIEAIRPSLKITDIILFNLCFIVVAFEAGLRIYAEYYPSNLLVRMISDVEDRVNMHRYPAGTMRFGFPCNEGGHYDSSFFPKNEGEDLIVTIGDSFSTGTVPHPYHYTSVCESKLDHAQVYNMGFCAIGPREYLSILKKEALKLNPDLVVISLFIGNDLTDNLKSLRLIKTENRYDRLIRSLFDLENILLYLLPKRLSLIANEEEKLAFGNMATLQDEDWAGDSVFNMEDIRKGQFPWLLDPLKETPYFTKETFLNIECNRAKLICAENPEYYKEIFCTIIEMRELLQEKQFAIMLIPDEFQVDDALWKDISDMATNVVLKRDRPQFIIRQWLEEQNIPCLDLLPYLRKHPPLEDGKLHLYHLQNTHFNARGNIVAGDALADFVNTLLK